MRRTSHAIVLGLSLVSSANAVLAWGREGHRLVAKIAARNLSPEARGKIAAILGTTDAGVEEAMAAASLWPDEIDRKSTGTAAWHYIDVPAFSPFTVAGLCPHHACVIDQINDMQARLSRNGPRLAFPTTPSPPRPAASQELAFLIHFAGDIHQPLHAANNGDRGGNCVTLTEPLVHADGRQPTTELHAVWDVDEVLAVLASLGPEDAAAAALVDRFRAGAGVPQGTAAEWARESHALAKADIYDKLRIPARTAPPGQCAPGIAGVTVNRAYLDGNVDAVERRLMRAGIRLSNVLNQICAGPGCKAGPNATP